MKEKKVYKTSEVHVSLANLQRFKNKNDETYAPKSHGHSNATTGASGFMSNTDKAKLDGIAAGANNYVHPNDANTRHVTDAEKATWNGKADGNHGHSNATTGVSGFMSNTDKTKLDGIAAGANNYVHPGSGTNPHGTTKADIGLGNVQDISLNWAWGSATPTHIWGSQGDSKQSFVYNGGQLKTFIGLPNVNNWGASSAIGANSTTEYATTNMVAQVRAEKANVNHTHGHLEINNSEAKNLGRLQMFQMSGNSTINPGGGWYSTLRMQHSGYTNGYWQEISLPFDSDNLYFRRNVNGSINPWRTVWHNGNFDPNSKANTNHTHNYMGDGGTYGTVTFSNWVRASGSSGIFFSSYGGGWHMTDSTWIRSYNNKPIHVSGADITCTNNIIAYYSDERLKKNFKKVDNALSMVMSVNPYYYEQNDFAKELGYNEEGKIQLGFKAQEMERILPQVIQEAPVNHKNDLSDEVREKIGDNPIKTIDYGKLTPLLWKAIQEQQKQIEKLEAILKTNNLM